MDDHDTHPLHFRITIAGTVSDRFARGCLCEVTARTEGGTSTLECDISTAAGLGAVLTGLANLGVEVLAVDVDARERHDGHDGHDEGGSR